MTAGTARTSASFLVAGVVMIVTTAYVGLGALAGFDERWFALVMAGFGVSMVAAALGVFGLAGHLVERTPVLGRVAAAAAAVAALGASGLAVLAVARRTPWDIPEPYAAILVLGTLGGLLVAFVLSGLAALRAAVHPRAVGLLLLAGGLALLGPLADALGWGPPDWLPLVILASWGALFLAVGLVLRSHRPAPDPAVAWT